jgi:hypothetical protein
MVTSRIWFTGAQKAELCATLQTIGLLPHYAKRHRHNLTPAPRSNTKPKTK